MSDTSALPNLDQLIQKVDDAKKQNKMDLSSDQDLVLAIMNLVSIEEHFIFTANKTEKPEYLDLMQEVRQLRTGLMKKIIKESEGEIWCISKHLLAASMRLMEVGTKQHKLDRKEEAREMFQKSYDLYNLFWGIQLKAISIGDVKKIDEGALNAADTEKKGFMGKLGALTKKLIDCCIE